MGYLYLGVAILCEVAGTAALQACDAFSRPVPSLVVVLGYAVAFLCLALTLRTIPVGIAYAIWAGAGVVLVALLSRVLFGHQLDAPAVLGMAMITAGVIIINAFSTSIHR
jgi:small multidrug resistance pump